MQQNKPLFFFLHWFHKPSQCFEDSVLTTDSVSSVYLLVSVKQKKKGFFLGVFLQKE